MFHFRITLLHFLAMHDLTTKYKFYCACFVRLPCVFSLRSHVSFGLFPRSVFLTLPGREEQQGIIRNFLLAARRFGCELFYYTLCVRVELRTCLHVFFVFRGQFSCHGEL